MPRSIAAATSCACRAAPSRNARIIAAIVSELKLGLRRNLVGVGNETLPVCRAGLDELEATLVGPRPLKGGGSGGGSMGTPPRRGRPPLDRLAPRGGARRSTSPFQGEVGAAAPG